MSNYDNIDSTSSRILAMAALSASLEGMKTNRGGLYSGSFLEQIGQFQVAVKEELRLWVEAEALDRREL